jgi:hypothetical protein
MNQSAEWGFVLIRAAYERGSDGADRGWIEGRLPGLRLLAPPIQFASNADSSTTFF